MQKISLDQDEKIDIFAEILAKFQFLGDMDINFMFQKKM